MTEAMNTGIETQDRGTVATSLTRLLADSYAVYLKTHGYHWNVRGPYFASLHALFMEQYTEMWTAIDEVAERIRQLGELAPQGYAAFSRLSGIKDGDPQSGAEQMLEELVRDHETLIATAREALPLAQEAGDEVTIGLITDHLAAHEKHAWMLRTSLGR